MPLHPFLLEKKSEMEKISALALPLHGQTMDAVYRSTQFLF